jgi:hypothetical protein
MAYSINISFERGLSFFSRFVNGSGCDKTIQTMVMAGVYGNRGNFRARQGLVKDTGGASYQGWSACGLQYLAEGGGAAGQRRHHSQCDV